MLFNFFATYLDTQLVWTLFLFNLVVLVAPHTRLTSTKRFTNLKVNLKHLGLYIG